jgi:hypothetical protein
MSVGYRLIKSEQAQPVNVTGDGINIAQQMMNCDADHILLYRAVARAQD